MSRDPRRPLPPLDQPALERAALRYVERYATTRAKLVAYLHRKLRERGREGEIDVDALADRMAERLRAQLQPSALEVLDESWQHEGHAGANGTGFGTHFRVRIASPLFEGKPRVARHRMVYDALQDFIDRDGVHALAIEATSP